MLLDLGRKLNGAISRLGAGSAIDEAQLDDALKAVSGALLEADVNVRLVAELRKKVKTQVQPRLAEIAEQTSDTAVVGAKQRQAVHRALFENLVELVSPKKGISFEPKKGKPNVIMFVGLQGAGKTTTCTKLASHYQRRGFRTALVCADTFRAGAFDQLKQNAVKAKVPFYGSYIESDPAVIAAAGVDKFKLEHFEVIIVDTSGRHRQEQDLFAEMQSIDKAVKPDQTILVLDGSIGQAAQPQAQAFKETANYGAIIVTKLDGHAKGGGALSAVAATQTPIAFLGTGEHFQDLDKFSPTSFVSRMLNMGDMTGLMEHAKQIQETNPESRENFMRKMQKGEFLIKDLKEQMASVLSMGPLSKLTSMIPGMADMGNDSTEHAKRIMYIFDSMTPEELESDGTLFYADLGAPNQTPRAPNKRILRIAKGSGTSVAEVEELLVQHHMVAQMVKQAGGKSGYNARRGMPNIPMGPNGLPDMTKVSPGQMQQMQQMIPPHMRAQIQQMQQNPEMMRQAREMMRGGGMPDMSSLMGGGMPDMSSLMGGLGGMFGR